MSYLNAASKIQTLEETGIGGADSYTYEDFKRDMVMLESTMYTEINKCVDEMSIDAIHAITEGASIDGEKVKNTKKYVDSVFKDSCDKIYDMQVAFISAQYNRAHKIISKKIQFMEEHKLDIENTMIGSSYNKCEGKCIKVGNVETYSDIFKPFKKSFPAVDSALDSKKYHDEIVKYILGSKETVSADTIEKKKHVLMKNLMAADKSLSEAVNNNINSCKYYKPNSCTDKKVTEYKEYTEAAAKWVKEYCKVITMYCNEIAILLKKFIPLEEGGK